MVFETAECNFCIERITFSTSFSLLHKFQWLGFETRFKTPSQVRISERAAFSCKNQFSDFPRVGMGILKFVSNKTRELFYRSGFRDFENYEHFDTGFFFLLLFFSGVARWDCHC